MLPKEIDYKRLYEVTNLLLTSPLGSVDHYRGIGKTFARLHLMLQQSYINPNHSDYLYVGINAAACDSAMRDFYEMFCTAPDDYRPQRDKILRMHDGVVDRLRNNRYSFISFERFLNRFSYVGMRPPVLALIDFDPTLMYEMYKRSSSIVENLELRIEYRQMLEQLYARKVRCI